MPGKRLENGELRRGYGYAAPRRFEEMYEPPQKLPRRPNVKLSDGCPTDELLPGYFGACTAIDEAFGSVVQALNELGVSEDTIVVFTSDHGEMLGSQGRITKGVWYEEAIGVPLLIRWSKRIQPQKTKAMFNSIDLMLTLLGLLGIPCPPGTTGSISPLACWANKSSLLRIECSSASITGNLEKETEHGAAFAPRDTPM
jgi:arylsulfatase A-like enzyme